MIKLGLILSLALSISTTASARESADPSQTLFKNVSIFNGTDDQLIAGKDVLIEGNLIKAVGSGLAVAADVHVIDGGGRTLMPGIIEAHGHISLPVPLDQVAEQVDWQYLGIGAAVNAEFYLMNGWTTVRDVGGPVFGIKKAVDEGLVPGPRIYPSGRFLSQTSGHADVRAGFASPHPNDLPVEPWVNREFFALADGVPEVLRATREELRKGAVHIKLMAGGGIASQYDPIHTNQYLPAEIEAAVAAADDWGTYVMVHAYTDASVRRTIEAGVKVIEHGQLMTEETARLAAEKDVWLSTQIAFLGEPPTPEQIAVFGETVAAKFNQVRNGVETSIKFAKQHGIKIAFGTDLWGPRLPEINNEFEYRSRYFSNLEVLQQATSINGELLRLTGPLNPYPDGPIGVLEKGAYADILLVDGNPLDDVTILVDASNIDLVMKDGVIYKDKQD